jgi:1-acyl-sn-glycerol-3-phosphate acyltransferase
MTSITYRPAPEAGMLPGISWRILHWLGWRIVLPEPVPAKCVVLVYPHTSNWDFPLGLFAQWALCLHARWVGKDTLFRWPLRWFFLRWGGIPVNRRERTGFAEAMRDAFARSDGMRLVITPEATRSYVDHWKSGFYHIARAAGVPVALAFIDYPRREIGFLGQVDLTGNIADDMAVIAQRYVGKTGRNPECQGPVRLREGS